MKRLAATIAVCSIVLSACGTSKKANVPMQDQKPTLSVSVKVEGTQATMTVQTDLRISKENYGGARKTGEGHIHTYLDGGEKVSMDEIKKTYTDLVPGKHELKVSLHNNDHTPYDVTETVSFEIK